MFLASWHGACLISRRTENKKRDEGLPESYSYPPKKELRNKALCCRKVAGGEKIGKKELKAEELKIKKQSHGWTQTK